ncbi:hypothetical protein SELMODRAFT_131998 [Selaginella moellendorffii]|uniref:Uncharacterized protein n=1 Tax=Selaginella moellendorffii TaxID=88036 RepID=D8T537_SELML|nr:protein-lysine methyltransferase METTL21D [Selaginella moellendorffii]EFJ08338.1 hypothetical protein SELMODRAFT_131998 [Selaginella moellendorffii]|eukprot:XP_002990706.1 protein-lysine methyltransferase METTL21D [Selaginella moellendorffii]
MRQVEIGRTSIAVLEDDPSREGKCFTGAWVWDCALVLTHWLDSIAAIGESGGADIAPVSAELGLGHHGFKDKRVVELGAGTGLPGMAAALLGASEVILTDRAGLLPCLRRNVEANQLESRVRVLELEWGADCSQVAAPVDFVLCSDILYDIEAVPALAKTLLDLSGESTRILLAYELRIGTTECFHKLRELGLEFTRVPSEELHPQWQSEDIGIFILRRSYPETI